MNRIIALRPFADKADFLKRVNQEAINARQHVGQKLLARFQFERVELPRTRNVDYAHEQFGLHIEVPYSAWDGWPVGSDHQRGIVWDFNRRHAQVHDPLPANRRLGLAATISVSAHSWAELFGEAPCL